MKDTLSIVPVTGPSIIGTGLIALDVVIQGNEYQSSKRWAGGTCGNVLIILGYLGWNAYPVARLNGEPASRRVLKDLKRWKLNLDFAKSVPRVNTPIVIHKIIKNGSGAAAHRFSLRCPNCGCWLPTYRPITTSSAQRVVTHMNDPNVFFFDRVSRGSIMLAKESAERGALIVFEPSGVGDPKLFQEAVSISHIIKYSRERMGDSLKLSNRTMLEIQTLGSEGLRYRSCLDSVKTKGWEHLDPCQASSVRDTAGAGDWCTAGIIHRLGQGGVTKFEKTSLSNLERALRFGQALAAWTCGFEGARGGMYEVDQATFELQVVRLMSQSTPQELNSRKRSTSTALVIPSQSQRLAQRAPSSRTVHLVSLQAQDACCF